jgi:hypothetical protein
MFLSYLNKHKFEICAWRIYQTLIHYYKSVPQNKRRGVAKINKIRIHPEYYWLGLFDIYTQYALQLLKHFNFEQVGRKF